MIHRGGNVILELTKVFLNENESLSVHEDIIFSDMQENFKEPVSADITVTNRAGIAEFESDVVFDYFCECDRCLQPVKKHFVFRFSHILIAEAPKDESDDYIQAPDYKLDTVSLLRDDILLELPSKFLCKESCKGLCPKCGKNLNEGECSCQRHEPDPRLAVLKQLLSE